MVSACEGAVALLRRMGAEIVDITIPEIDHIRIAHLVTFLSECYALQKQVVSSYELRSQARAAPGEFGGGGTKLGPGGGGLWPVPRLGRRRRPSESRASQRTSPHAPSQAVPSPLLTSTKPGLQSPAPPKPPQNRLQTPPPKPPQTTQLHEDSRVILSVGKGFTGAEYLQAARLRRRQWEHWRRAFERCDVIASPTTACVAPRIALGAEVAGGCRQGGEGARGGRGAGLGLWGSGRQPNVCKPSVPPQRRSPVLKLGAPRSRRRLGTARIPPARQPL